MIYLLAPLAPLIAFVAILAGVASAKAGRGGVRLVALPYLGPLLMIIWSVALHNRPRHGMGELRDLPEAVLALFGAVGIALFLWTVIRHRRMSWRWIIWLNALPVVLATSVVWLWGTFWMWRGP